MSTRKVAMCAMYVLGDLVEALKTRGRAQGCMPPWRRPSRIWRVMPNARIPHGIDRQGVRSWVSNPALRTRT